MIYTLTYLLNYKISVYFNNKPKNNTSIYLGDDTIEIIKKVAVFHDLCSEGRVALSVIIPTMSSLKVQISPYPTVLLTSHPAGFKSVVTYDMTAQLRNSIKSIYDNKITYDCVFSGFINSIEQIDIIRDYFLGCNSIKVVDPVIGDNGHIYSFFDYKYVQHMIKLVEIADIITPNITEALLLLGRDFKAEHTKQELLEIAKELHNLGAKTIIITSCKSTDGKYNVLLENNSVHFIPYQTFGVNFPGAGDIFCSVITGYYLNNGDIVKSAKLATDFLTIIIQDTVMSKTPIREGVLLENHLHLLHENL